MLCASGGRIASAVPPPAKTRIDLVSDGTNFRPSPASKAILEKWRAESPDATQLEAAAPAKLED